MNCRILSILVLSALTLGVFGQSITPSFRASLPDIVDESSGIEVLSDGSLVSFNDSGGDNCLFIFNSFGSLLRTIEIVNATNVDWEEISQDEDGWIYVGDFGNNSNNRTNLRVYAIPNPLGFIEDTVSAEIIEFEYEDQTAFPPIETERNFDMEAMVAYGDSLYLFSKCRTEPFSGVCKLYSIPKFAGTYEAHLIDSFYTTASSDLAGQVTAADINLVGQVFVMTYRNCYLLSEYSGTNFFSGENYSLGINTLTQIEACCFYLTDGLYITDEIVSYMGIDFGGALYTLDISDYMIIEEIDPTYSSNSMSAFPNPFNKEVAMSGVLGVEIYNLNGKLIDKVKSMDGSHLVWKPGPDCPSGIYIARADSPGIVKELKIVFSR